MKRFWGFTLLLVILLAACAPAGSGTEPAAVDNVDANADVPPTCPATTAETELLQHQAYGYCLLFPAAYQVRNFEDNVVELVLDSPLNNTDPRLMMKVEPTNGRSAQQVADDFFNQLSPELIAEYDVKRATVEIDGATAHVIDNIPEQNLSRYLFVVNDGLLYSMTFSPVDAAQMDTFYSDLLNSFRFVPVVTDAPLDAGDSLIVREDD